MGWKSTYTSRVPNQGVVEAGCLLLVDRGWKTCTLPPSFLLFYYFFTPCLQSRITNEDLWDHAWEFHFKKSAPAYWRNMDPHWIGTGPPMRRYFHPDGSQTADPGDKVWGGHECCYSIVTGLLADGNMREHYVRINRWPHMSISRKKDWGWKMSNHLYSYSSVPDAGKKGGTGPL